MADGKRDRALSVTEFFDETEGRSSRFAEEWLAAKMRSKSR
ncbi:MAG: hypothetical protein ACYCWN_08370 [Ferrimicrobium sp.]|jgi:hypothetical protein|nr:hypothetical protein [Ferrimicrobium sp.]